MAEKSRSKAKADPLAHMSPEARAAFDAAKAAKPPDPTQFPQMVYLDKSMTKHLVVNDPVELERAKAEGYKPVE
jgi:hypothetical protein